MSELLEIAKTMNNLDEYRERIDKLNVPNKTKLVILTKIKVLNKINTLIKFYAQNAGFSNYLVKDRNNFNIVYNFDIVNKKVLGECTEKVSISVNVLTIDIQKIIEHMNSEKASSEETRNFLRDYTYIENILNMLITSDDIGIPKEDLEKLNKIYSKIENNNI